MVQGSPCPWKNVAGCFEGGQPAAHAISIVNFIVVKTRIASRELRPPFFWSCAIHCRGYGRQFQTVSGSKTLQMHEYVIRSRIMLQFYLQMTANHAFRREFVLRRCTD